MMNHVINKNPLQLFEYVTAAFLTLAWHGLACWVVWQVIEGSVILCFKFGFNLSLLTIFLAWWSNHTFNRRVFFSQPQNNKIVFQCKHGFKPNYIADSNGHVHLVTYQENRDEESAGYFESCLAGTQSSSGQKTDLGKLTNKCCRYLYPISFAIFNLGYWLALSA